MDDLDFSIDAMYVTPPRVEVGGWLGRRQRGIGASEVAVCGVIAGDIHPASVPKTHAAMADIMKRGAGAGLPRLVAEKAGLASARRGSEVPSDYLEHELLEAFRPMCPALGLDGRSLTHSSAAPTEWYPLVCRDVPRLLCSPDGWARDDFGDLVTVDWKRSTKHGPSAQSLERWRWQIVAQCMTTGASYGFDVVGIGWVEAKAPGGPVEAYKIEPTDEDFALVKKWVTHVWSMVESAKEER